MKKSDIVLAAVLVFSVFVFISSRLGTNNFLVVLSESMSPTINMGDLVITTTNSDNINVGDIVVFEDGDKRFPVTHRVVNITEEGLVTKGDANEDPDIKIRTSDMMLGKVVSWIPFAGYVVYFARSFYGFIFLIIIPGILLIFNEIKNISRYVKEGKKKKRKKKSKIYVSMILITFLALTLGSSIMNSSAYFSDIEIGSGLFTAWVETFTVEKWWSDTNLVPMSDIMYNDSFEVVIHENNNKATSTNPGGFFININVNDMPSTSSIIITDIISNNLRAEGDFVEQSGKPFHAFLDGLDVSKKFDYVFNGITFYASLKPGEQIDSGDLYVNFHVKYGLLKTKLTQEEIDSFPHEYSNLASVKINDETIQSSAAVLTAYLKWVGDTSRFVVGQTPETTFDEDLEVNETNYTNTTNETTLFIQLDDNSTNNETNQTNETIFNNSTLDINITIEVNTTLNETQNNTEESFIGNITDLNITNETSTNTTDLNNTLNFSDNTTNTTFIPPSNSTFVNETNTTNSSESSIEEPDINLTENNTSTS